MFQTKVVEKIKTHTLNKKKHHSWDNLEKYCTVGQVTDDNIMRCMRIACCIPKATNTYSEYVTHFSTETMVARYIVRKLLVLLKSSTIPGVVSFVI